MENIHVMRWPHTTSLLPLICLGQQYTHDNEKILATYMYSYCLVSKRQTVMSSLYFFFFKWIKICTKIITLNVNLFLCLFLFFLTKYIYVSSISRDSNQMYPRIFWDVLWKSQQIYSLVVGIVYINCHVADTN